MLLRRKAGSKAYVLDFTYFCFFMLLIYYIYFLCLKKLRQVHCMLKWQACSNTCPGGRMLNLPHLKLRLNLRNNCEIRKWLIANCLQVLWGRPRRLLMCTGQGHPNHRPHRPHSWDLDLPKVAWLLQNLLTYRAVQLKNIYKSIFVRGAKTNEIFKSCNLQCLAFVSIRRDSFLNL